MMADNHNTNEDEDILVTLDLDDGSQVECEILTIFTLSTSRTISPFFRSPKPASRTRTARSISTAMRRIAMAIRLWIIF